MTTEFLKGNIEIILLTVLDKEDRYGYEIIKNIHEKSGLNVRLTAGSLYPALQRLENKGFLTSYWQGPDGDRHRYYHITDSGRKELQARRESWAKMARYILAEEV